MHNWPLKPFILAHRGARSQAPENTLEAFQKAFELGADGIECDVFLSKDGIPVVIHDETLDRTTKNTGFVWDHDSQALQKLGVPTLEQALSSLPNSSIINIELKGCRPYSAEFLANQVSNFLKFYQDKIKIIISSFDPELLKIWTRDPYPIGLLFESTQALICPTDWRPDATHLDHSCLAKAPAGFKIVLWTAPDLSTARAWLAQGVDGVIAEF